VALGEGQQVVVGHSIQQIRERPERFLGDLVVVDLHAVLLGSAMRGLSMTCSKW
jgi:hypothetical protein